jgi:hypothetical protein
MIPATIALVSDCSMPLSTLSIIAGALQKQVLRDVSPAWNTDQVVVAAYPKGQVPIGAWSITVVDVIAEPEDAGYHDDDNGQPYAVVKNGPDVSVTLSHELIEMIVDPFGSRLVPGWAGGARVQYLVEVCDPCEEETYQINGIAVSDFVLPAYYGETNTGDKCCFTGEIKSPLDVSRGGYLSWLSGVSWYQKTWTGDRPEVKSLGYVNLEPHARNPRSAINYLKREWS